MFEKSFTAVQTSHKTDVTIVSSLNVFNSPFTGIHFVNNFVFLHNRINYLDCFLTLKYGSLNSNNKSPSLEFSFIAKLIPVTLLGLNHLILVSLFKNR